MPDYANLRIAHGKDRCANPPRSGPQGGGGMRRSNSGNHAASVGSPGGDGVEGEVALNGTLDPGLIDEDAEGLLDVDAAVAAGAVDVLEPLAEHAN